MQYDSYRFTSARWSLIEHHFCKLDSWLEGFCTPQHPEICTPKPGRKGGRAAVTGSAAAALVWDPKKFSIFAAGADDDDDDDQGGQDDGQQAGDD